MLFRSDLHVESSTVRQCCRRAAQQTRQRRRPARLLVGQQAAEFDAGAEGVAGAGEQVQTYGRGAKAVETCQCRTPDAVVSQDGRAAVGAVAVSVTNQMGVVRWVRIEV